MHTYASNHKEPRKDARLIARTSAEVHSMIQKAAEYSGTTVSQFLIESAVKRARDVIDQTETLHLSHEGAVALFNALDNPPEPNEKLLNAFKKYKDVIHGDND